MDVKELIASTAPPQKRQKDFRRAGKKKKRCGENEFLPARPFKLGNLYVVFFRAARPLSGGAKKNGMDAPACVAPFQRTLARVRVWFPKNLWRLASRCLKMSPNFVIEGQPFRKLLYYKKLYYEKLFSFDPERVVYFFWLRTN